MVMGHRGFSFVLITTVACAALVSPLRLLKVLIPPYAVRGSPTELTCEFDSGRSPLYSVKWFKDDKEFFRYVPAAKNQYQVFTPEGLTVDDANSRASRVVLRDLGFAASGNYRCEVSTEGPEFSTVIGQGTLLVVEPLSSNPKLTGGRRKYSINDTVDIICTSSPSRPAAHLSWVINGKNAPRDQVVDGGLRQQPDGLMVRTSRIRFVASPSHFINGRLSIKCVASLSRPSNTLKNSRNKDTNVEILPDQLLAHFFNKWENTLEVSSSMSAHGMKVGLAAFLTILIFPTLVTSLLFTGHQRIIRSCEDAEVDRDTLLEEKQRIACESKTHTCIGSNVTDLNFFYVTI